ncbi:MAG: hypothetical protein O7H41_15285 [Planctomycetota bacterium]|nr:hypothetical protein [Planctomycetota bacterium]
MKSARTGSIVVSALLILGLTACGGGGGGAGKKNAAPSIAGPSGPGTPAGMDPTYSTLVTVGDSLDFSVAATDPNAANLLTFTATVTGGNLNASQAGFALFSTIMVGSSPQILTFTGTAAMAGQIVITFDVDDGSATDSITLTIDFNDLPVIAMPTGPGTVGGTDPTYSTTVNLGDSLDFSVTATDTDAADVLVLDAAATGGTLSEVQAGFTVFPITTTGVSPISLSFVGIAAMTGDVTITLDLSDGRGGTGTITHTITINSVPQIASPSGPGLVMGASPTYTSTITIGGSIAFDVTATDANLTDTLTFTASVTGGSLSGAQAGINEMFPSTTMGSSPQTLSFTGTAAMSGTITLTLDVDDGLGAADQVTLTITINTPPQLAIPSGPGTVGGSDPAYSTMINAGASLGFDVTATDPDLGDTLTTVATVTGGFLSAAQAGFIEVFPVTTMGPSPHVLSLTGTAALAGDIEITFSVDDGRGGMDTITHTIAINAPPVIGMPSGPGVVGGSDPAYTTTINIGDSVGFSITITDANPTDNLDITVTDLGGSLTAAQAGFIGTFPALASGISPLLLGLAGTAAMAGDVVLTFDVVDPFGAMDQVTHTITINTPPQIAAPAGPGPVGGTDPSFTTTVFVGDSLDFSLTATDADIDFLNFTGTATGGSLTAAQSGFTSAFPMSGVGFGGVTLTPLGTAAMAGDIELTFDVDDGRGGTDLITHTITIIPDTTAPDPIGDLAATFSGALDTITLTWTASGDDMSTGTASGYILKFSAAPIANQTDFDGATTYPQTWTPLAAGSPETQLIDLTLVGYSWYGGIGYFAIEAVDEVPNQGALLNPLTVNTNLVTTFPPPALSYGAIDFRNAAPANFDYTNTSSLVDLVITSVALTGDPEFSITAGGGGPFTVAPGNTHTVTVEFLPLTINTFAGSLDVTHNDTSQASPYMINLSGEGANAIPVIQAKVSMPNPAQAATMPTLQVRVLDLNNELPGIDDIASATIDLTAIGGSATQAMTLVGNAGPKVGIYEVTVDTTGLTTDVYDLAITVTDVAGSFAEDTLGFTVYSGAVLNVPTVLYPFIQDAIDAAANGDIVLVQDGTYTAMRDKNLQTNGKSIIVMSQNGAVSTRIDCLSAGRAFLFNNSGETTSTVIYGFEIVNATASGVWADINASPRIVECLFSNNTYTSSNGGAIYLSGAGVSPLIERCTFDGNFVDIGNNGGGAIWAQMGAQPTIEDCLFINNDGLDGATVAGSGSDLTVTGCTFTTNGANCRRGGALYLVGGISTVTNCTFDQNLALVTFGFTGHGGAAYVAGACTFTNCVFVNNSCASKGGAVNVAACSVDFIDCTFNGNSGGSGGAVLVEGCRSNFTDCIFMANTAINSGGGLLYQVGNAGVVKNCLFAGNTAGLNGGGLYSNAGSGADTLRILSCTFSGNTAVSGGGIYFYNQDAVVTDTIVWGNTATTSGEDVFCRSVTTLGVVISFSDIDTAAGKLEDPILRINPPVGFVPGTSGNLSLDPLFVTGLRGDYYLTQILAGQGIDSPCFDAGSDTSANLGLNLRTTATNGALDAGTVDMGYHFEP